MGRAPRRKGAGGKKDDVLGPLGHTARGFELIEFDDCHETHCELQQSSLAEYAQPGTSAVWLGLAGDEPKKHHTFGTSLGMRMHLNRVQAKALIRHLQAWLKHGSFASAQRRTGE